jgi:Zn-finger nucleic acid-binding protein
MRLFYVLIGLIPVVGWIIYLIVRPSETIDEIYWGDLERRYLKYEAKDLGDCPRCGTQLYPGFIFCPTCKKRLKRKCSNCEVYVDLEYKYCPHCGNKMTHKTKREKEITQEEMQKQIEETKEEAHETVKSKKSKYKQEQNFVNRVGESVIKGYKILGEKARKSIDDFKEKISRKNKATKAGNNEINEDNEKSSNDKREEKNKVVNENKTK